MLNFDSSELFNIFIADDLTLKLKSISLEAVVKSSKIMALLLFTRYMPSFRLYNPI